MTADCQWVEKNLEALFCDRLSEEEGHRLREHIESCVACGKEVQALNAVDPLIKSYFQRELRAAGRPAVVHKGRVLGVSSLAGAAAVAVLLLLARTPQPPPPAAPVAISESSAPVQAVVPAPPVKIDQFGLPVLALDEPVEVKRMKPEPALPI